jgi:hypothetical protein
MANLNIPDRKLPSSILLFPEINSPAIVKIPIIIVDRKLIPGMIFSGINLKRLITNIIISRINIEKHAHFNDLFLFIDIYPPRYFYLRDYNIFFT